jgi:DNA-binding response OmpR family regulator/energy-coupling factor transporter ATP-binding protein EcfA2
MVSSPVQNPITDQEDPGDRDTILVVEDDPQCASLLKVLLEDEGHPVVLASTGGEGQRILRDAAISLVLLDLRLPDMNGTDLMQDVQRLDAPPEVVVITAHATLESAIMAIEAGAAGYILKPVDPTRFRALVGKVLERRRLQRENAALYERIDCERRRLQALYEVSRHLISVRDIDDVLSLIVRETSRLLGAEAVALRLLEGEEFVLKAYTELAGALISRIRVSTRASLSGLVLAAGEPVVIEDLLEDTRHDPAYTRGVANLGFRGFLGVPLRAHGETIGALNVYTIDMDLGGFKADLRASAVPTQWGEKLVLRMLSKEASVIDLEGLGLDPTGYQIVLRNLLRPFGMLLITGPTGSGKSTTLSAMLQRLAAERQNMVNITTIEDPVESTIPRINQIPINLAAGLDFAAGLRAVLRQDPDVIMVGEMRDRETAELGVRAALLGRLLLSTLHTNDATAAVPRLMDMGIESFLLASTLSLVVGQRLVRRICTSYRESVTPEESVLRALQARPDFEATIRILRDQGVLSKGADPLSALRLFRGKGCRQCGGTGFKGRLGVFELFEIDEQVRGMIMERRDAASIRAAAISRGMKTMFQDGLAKVFLGETTLEEVFRVAL